MINETTIKEFRLEKEYTQVLDLFNGNIDKVEMYISTDKRVNKVIPVSRGGYSFDVKSIDLLELEAKEKGLDVMVFDENADFAKDGQAEDQDIEDGIFAPVRKEKAEGKKKVVGQ